MRKSLCFLLLFLCCIAAILLGIGIGSVFISPKDGLNIFLERILGAAPFGITDEVQRSILWEIRIPRTMLAFACGAGLAVSGVIMQSVLRNPLASSYTLGVSSGAAVGASFVILSGFGALGIFTLPAAGLTGGMLTVLLALGIAAKIDRGMQNNSVILTGMALSLFANAAMTILMSLSKDQLQRLVFWQMGSFAMKGSEYPAILFPMVIVGVAVSILLARQMDLLTLGDEQARVSGVNTKQMKWLLLCLGAALTGSVVSMVGVIGFIDLFTPHAARKLFGASHRALVPASALMGGAFMVLCDLLARTVIAPVELPVGAITSILGAPFFIYLFFSGRKKAGAKG